MSIDYEHAQHSKYATVWKKINDICDYETVTDYLIELNPDDDSEENASRNSQFQDRAVFSDIAGQTVRGFVGLVFNKEPNAELPAGLDYLEENADGAGVSIYQQSQEVVEDLARVSLAGLWVDFPKTDGPVSAEDISSRKVFATINHFAASQIWNWRTGGLLLSVSIDKYAFISSLYFYNSMEALSAHQVQAKYRGELSTAL